MRRNFKNNSNYKLSLKSQIFPALAKSQILKFKLNKLCLKTTRI